ncbi:MAG: L-seryl-tRNA(Sec) selenium transferase [Lachnospiraceae bacterium]|nr:L-seryl-tRNA(Sec) selenium transferase [Lachnospiraceae bacterium]
MNKDLYRKIPKVDVLLDMPEIQELTAEFGKRAVTECIREELDRMRDMLRQRTEDNGGLEEFQQERPQGTFEKTFEIAFEKKLEELPSVICACMRERELTGFRRVINATGTILHTNLGRAPIAKEHAQKIAELVSGYSNLEYSLEEGHRGERYSHFEHLICQVTGAESAMAVNNNAGAVLLTLSALACGKEVIVSRGEQIEIGGKFRVPDVIRQGGASLCEVGTTNKTHLSDYDEAINENTGLLLKVHTSNYRIIGFSESVSTRELAELSVERGVPFVEDLGSGILVDLRRYGITGEPTVQEVLAAGADVVCFSGDKLLGGPQAGIIAGKKKYIDQIKKHPLTRALRIDKFTAASLELVWREYYRCSPAQLTERIPVLKMLASTCKEQELRARKVADAWKSTAGNRYEITVQFMQAQMGGGTLPLHQFDGAGVVIAPRTKLSLTTEQLEAHFRRLDLPVVGRIQDGQFQLHMQTVFDEEIPLLIEEGLKVLSEGIA